MVRKFDAEDMLDGILQIMTDGLNARIAAIEAEKVAAGKGLTPTLAAIPTDGYYLQSWSEKILMTNPSIFYGIEEVTTIDGGFGAAKKYKLFAEIVLVDSGMTADADKRILRYTRALEEIFTEAFKNTAEVGRAIIETVRPASFKLDLDSSEEMKVGGIAITLSLA